MDDREFGCEIRVIEMEAGRSFDLFFPVAEVDPVLGAMLGNNRLRHFGAIRMIEQCDGCRVKIETEGRAFLTAQRPWTRERFLMALEDFSAAWKEADQYLLNIEELFLDPMAVSVNTDEHLHFLALPFSTDSMDPGDFCLAMLNAQPISAEENTAYLATALNALRKKPFFREDWKQLIGEIRETCIQAPQEKKEKVKRSDAAPVPFQATAPLPGVPQPVRRDLAKPDAQRPALKEADIVKEWKEERKAKEAQHAAGFNKTNPENPVFAPVQPATPARAEVDGFFDLLTHFSRDRWETYWTEKRIRRVEEKKAAIPEEKKQLAKKRATGTFDKLKEHWEEKAPLLWEERGELGPFPAGKYPALRFEKEGEVPLSYFPVSIGRDASNDVVIHDRLMSGRHARLQKKGKRICIMDMRSKNGTAINNRYLQPLQFYPLEQGDRIRIGGVEAIFMQ